MNTPPTAGKNQMWRIWLSSHKPIWRVTFSKLFLWEVHVSQMCEDLVQILNS